MSSLELSVTKSINIHNFDIHYIIGSVLLSLLSKTTEISFLLSTIEYNICFSWECADCANAYNKRAHIKGAMQNNKH